MTKEVPPQIDHPQVRNGRLTHFYSPEHGWEFDLDKLPLAFRQSQVSLSQLLNPGQGWRAEGFSKPGIQSLWLSKPMFQFVFHASTPPLRHEQGFLLRRVSRLDLPQVLSQPGSRLTTALSAIFSGNSWGSQLLQIEPVPIGPFLTITSLEQSVVPFTVGEIAIKPFVLFDAKRPSFARGEDPTRMMVEVILQKPEEAINARIVQRREGWLSQIERLLTSRQPNGFAHELNIEQSGLPTLSSLAALEGFDRRLLERLRSLPPPM